MKNKVPAALPVVLSKSTPHKSAQRFREMTFPHLINFQDEWLTWNGSAYLSIEDKTMTARISQFLIDAFVQQAEEVTGPNGRTTRKPGKGPFNPKAKDISEVEGALKHLCHKSANTMAPPSWLDGRVGIDPRNIISCSNCLLDITTGKMYDQTPEFFMRTALPIEYNYLAPDPVEWLKYLSAVTDNRKPLIDLLQEMLGYMLTCDTSQQQVFLLLGPPRTGKGTFMRTASALIGPLNITSPTIEAIAGPFGLHPMVGKTSAFVTDMTCHDRQKLSTAANRINAISGEDPVSAPRKFKDPWEGRLLTRFLLASNHLPDFGDHSAAIAARLLIIPFEVSFLGREDRSLEAKLLAELPGILNWALEGLMRLRARGRFEEPMDSAKIKTRMLYLSNPVRGFIDQCCEIAADSMIEKAVLHDQYKVYCNELGIRPLARDVFAERLYELVPTANASRLAPGADGKRPQVFTGIRLNDALLYEHFEVDPFMADIGVTGPKALRLDGDGRPVPRMLN